MRQYEILDMLKGLDPDQIKTFRQEAIKRLAELKQEIEDPSKKTSRPFCEVTKGADDD